jgi:hypothetical protein
MNHKTYSLSTFLISYDDHIMNDDYVIINRLNFKSMLRFFIFILSKEEIIASYWFKSVKIKVKIVEKSRKLRD